MPDNNIRTGGAPQQNKIDSGGAVTVPYACIGIVKDNIDHTHTGRIKVYINRGGAVDPNNSKYWIGVSYLSPWFGVIAPGYDIYGQKGTDRTGFGKYVGNPHSYGFWATAPDIGTQVICIFINGRSDQGYYIGCVPQPGLTHMVPAIGSSTKVVPNANEASTYGGADRLPTVEVNYANPSIRNSPTIYSQPKPVHSYQASILAQQGLVRDNLRGVIGSSSQRETPSRVFGISTPGGPVYSGGYDKTNIKKAAETEDVSKLQTIGRTGGHTFVMDDGDMDGQDQLIRLRTSAGHMIMLNDSGQNLTIIHSNGQSWIELGREGTIDMYATNSVNIRTEGDLNLHADRDINLHAKRNLNGYGENIKLEADKNMTIRTNQNFNQYTVGTYTTKVDGPMSMESKGDASFHSKSITYINGRKVHLNTGQTGTVPKEVQSLPKYNQVDTTFSPNKGWMNPSPDPLVTIASRAPTHWPYFAAGKGVDVKTGSAQPASQPVPAPGIAAAAAAAANIPVAKTGPALVATAPSVAKVVAPGGPNLTPPIAQGMLSQQAVAAQAMSATQKVQNGIVGTAGSTISQLAAPGQSIKPGADALIKSIQTQVPGIPSDKAASKALMTGNFGVGSFGNLDKNIAAQTSAVMGAFGQGMAGLKKAGVISGTEGATQIAGAVQAAANYGAGPVGAILKNPASAVSNLGQTTNSIVNNVAGAATNPGAALGSAFGSVGSAIAGGNFSGSLADKLNSGMSGLGNSLSAIAGGALAGAGNTVAGIISGLAGLAKNAYNVTEKSFGELKANLPNFLGGQQNNTGTPSAASSALDDQSRANDEFFAAQESVSEAKKAYRLDPSEANLAKVREAEALESAALKKTKQAASKVFGGILGGGSAQQLASAAANVQSGQAAVSTTANSGLNAVPGGVGAYANEVSSSNPNVIGSIKNLASSVTAAGTGALSGIAATVSGAVGSAFSAASNLVGNIVNNAQNAVSTVANGIGSAVSGIAGAAGGAVAGATAALSNIVGGAKSVASGLMSKAQSAMSSLGNNSGQVKAPILASQTFTAAASQKTKVSQLIDDTKIPQPDFPDKPVEPPNDIAQAQAAAQTKLDKINELKAEQNKLLERYNQVYESIVAASTESGNTQQLYEQLEALSQQIERINEQLATLSET